MINHFKVSGLNGNPDESITFRLHHDLNIITGRNGAGKTTILKLMWYIISGNIERIFPEIDFQYVELTTDTVEVTISVDINNEDSKIAKQITVNWIIDDNPQELSVVWPFSDDHEEVLNVANIEIAEANGASVFFPTFRRIEGGFSLSSRGRTRRLRVGAQPRNLTSSSGGSPLQQAMSELSERISVMRHAFVASISTDDIITLLTKRYADISENTNRQHKTLSSFIIDKISAISLESKQQMGTDSDSLNEARLTLASIEERVKAITEEQDNLLRPFSTLSALIDQILHHKGIKVTEAITLG